VVFELVYASVFWLNAFPVSSGISKTISPHKLVTGGNIDYKKNYFLEFGSYVKHLTPMIIACYHEKLEPLHYVLLGTIKEVTTFLFLSQEEELITPSGQVFPCILS